MCESPAQKAANAEAKRKGDELRRRHKNRKERIAPALDHELRLIGDKYGVKPYYRPGGEH